MCVSKDIAKRSQNKQIELSLGVSNQLAERSMTELDMTKELGWHLLILVRITQIPRAMSLSMFLNFFVLSTVKINIILLFYRLLPNSLFILGGNMVAIPLTWATMCKRL